MQEIEVKILEIDIPKTAQQIEQLGGAKVFEGRITAHYLDTPNDDLWKEGTVLRIRRRGDITELTLKKKVKKRKDIKVRDEYEVKVGDFEATKALFAELGYIEKAFKEDKHRITYALGDSHIELETVENIPPYLEIEAPSVERLEEVVSLLGFTMEDTKPWTAGEVRAHYGEKFKKV